jgi:hypothetical protein
MLIPGSKGLDAADKKRTLVVSKTMVSVNCPILLNAVTVTGIATGEAPGVALITMPVVVTGASAANRDEDNSKNKKTSRNANFFKSMMLIIA